MSARPNGAKQIRLDAPHVVTPTSGLILLLNAFPGRHSCLALPWAGLCQAFGLEDCPSRLVYKDQVGDLGDTRNEFEPQELQSGAKKRSTQPTRS